MLIQVRRDSCVLHHSRSNVCSCMSRTHIYVTNSCVCHELIESNASVYSDMWDGTHAWLNSSETLCTHVCHELIYMLMYVPLRLHKRTVCSSRHELIYMSRTHLYVTDSSICHGLIYMWHHTYIVWCTYMSCDIWDHTYIAGIIYMSWCHRYDTTHV